MFVLGLVTEMYPGYHPARSEGSGEPGEEILRCAQDDMHCAQDDMHCAQDDRRYLQMSERCILR